MTTQPPARVLDAAKVVETVARLQARIAERFPGSGLASVCGSLASAAELTAAREAELARPILPLRILAVVVVIAAFGAQIYVAVLMDWGRILMREDPASVAERARQLAKPHATEELATSCMQLAKGVA